jgi:vancomycin resistance protein YoaR
VPLRFRVDTAAVHAIVAARDPLRTPPVEPFVKAKPGGSGFTIVEAKPGKGIDADAVVAALPKAAAQGQQIVVQVGRGSVPPRISKAQAEALAKRAERDVAKPVTVTAGPAKATIPVSTLRTWFHSQAEGDQLSLVIDPATALAALPKLLPKATTPAVETTFTVTGNQPQPKFGRAGSTCCGDAAPGLIQQAVLEGSRSAGSGTTASPVQLPLRTVPPRINPENLATVGIKEQVATFTTNHPAGQPRVTNIHRMADMVKGQVIMPGETFSLNGFVGERTVAKGFVVDHQINDEGKFDEAVGGGVSQFATTTFNAAFFAGLDFGEYQSHTIYISRYPYGREATVSWRHPDLQVKNTTPFGVLLWADYTGTSLTVRMFSTKFLASVTQSAQSQAPFGPGCTRVTTERTRTYLDGRTAIDKLFALYQPAEGVKCR